MKVHIDPLFKLFLADSKARLEFCKKMHSFDGSRTFTITDSRGKTLKVRKSPLQHTGNTA